MKKKQTKIPGSFHNGILLGPAIVKTGSFQICYPEYAKLYKDVDFRSFVKEHTEILCKVIAREDVRTPQDLSFDIQYDRITKVRYTQTERITYRDLHIVFNYYGSPTNSVQLYYLLSEIRSRITNIIKELKPKNYKPIPKKVISREPWDYTKRIPKRFTI